MAKTMDSIGAMGNREDLLAGALACLKDKGWARTTVRDIAAAAGVNHAAIGYHFGSRDALLTEAFVRAMEEWGLQIEAAAHATVDPDATPRSRYEAFWEQALVSFSENRPLWLASVEAGIEAQRSPRIRELMIQATQEGRSGLAAGLLGIPEDTLAPRDIQTIGALQLALVSGVMMQWTLDPDHAPTGPDITDGLIALADRITGTPDS